MKNTGTQADVLTWLAKRRVTVPDRVVGYMHRPEITAQCVPSDRPLTIVHAPAGFGKTTLVAESCRAEALSGIPTAWLVLDERDDEETLDTYLAFAFREAGLNIGSVLPDAAQVRESDRRISIALRAVEADARPWVLALDEVERVVGKGGLSVLNELFRDDVPNLHIVLTCRQFPDGMDIAWSLFDRAKVITAKELRFSRIEMARFFGGGLSRREVARVARESAGWPIALHVEREKWEQGRTESGGDVGDVAEYRLESRLWYDLARDERELVLDAGILEWMDAELIDEVLEGKDMMARLHSLPGLAGLLQPVRGGAGKVWRLHALVRELCVSWRRTETPARYRSIHRRMARAIARRGDTVAAARYAAEAGDAALLGEIVTEAGGVQLMLRDNSVRLLALDRLIGEETFALFPRLRLVRAVSLAYKGELEEAARQFAAVEPELRPAAANDVQLECDLNLAEAILAHNGSEVVDSPRQRRVFAVSGRLALRPEVDPVVRGDMELGMCYLHNLKGEFEPGLERVRRARRSFGDEAPYLQMVADFQCGQVAMARGRVQEAAAWYRKGATTSREHFLINPRVGALARVLTEELDFERNRVDKLKAIPLARASGDPASAEMAVEMARETRGTDYAVRVAEASRAGARRAALPRLERSLTGLFIATLVTAGRVEEAEAHWREQGLPQSFEGCVDLAGQSWREMEVVSSARLRLCTARGDFEAGRRLVTELLAVTRQRGLRRTEMRALAQALAHEHAAEKPVAALEHLAAFLRLFAKTDYARPIVRERASAVPVLTEYLETGPDLQLEDLAADLLMAARMADSDAIPKLTAREFEVLRRLETLTDRQIAVDLGLTRDGVRYHVRHLFQKLRVRGRKAATERARSVGIL